MRILSSYSARRDARRVEGARMDRVTNLDLDAVCASINLHATGQVVPAVWYRDDDGKLRQNPGVYYIDGAYGGVALYLTCDVDHTGESHGVHDVFRAGHMPKRELIGRMRAYLDGMQAVA